MQDLISKELDRFAAVKMQLLEMHPFWGYILLQMKIVPAVTLPAFAATDLIRHIWFNPLLTKDLSIREMGFLLLHEASHQILLNEERRKERDLFLWNQATDYVINDMIVEIKDVSGNEFLYDMLSNVLYAPEYHGMIAETVYESLKREKKDEKEIFHPVVLPLVAGSENMDENDPKRPSLQNNDEKKKKNNTAEHPGSGDGEEGENGKILRMDVLDHKGGIDIHLPLETGREEQEHIKDRILAAIENFRVNHSRGDFPGGVLRKLGLLGEARIPWQKLLRRFVDQCLSADDYSLARPNKRLLTCDFIVPGKYGENISNIVIALDTSGSMENDTLIDLLTELKGILPETEEITLIVADATIRQVIPMEQMEEALKECSFAGGGGTDHICVFEYIRKHHLDPVLFIGMTDLYSMFPEQAPPYPVVWLVPRSHNGAPWGKVIELPENTP